MKLLTILIPLLICQLTVVGQVDNAIAVLNNCDEKPDSGTVKMNMLGIDGQLILPTNWTGEWKDDNPSLYLTKKSSYTLDIFNAWDVYSKGELFDSLQSWHSQAKLCKIAETDCLVLTKSEGRYAIEIMVHEDNSDSFENRTVWTFGLLGSKRKLPDEIFCEVKYIIEQFITLYGEKKN